MRISIILLMVFSLFGCKNPVSENSFPVQIYFYEYIGFDVSDNSKIINQFLKEAYDTSDFIITKDEQFVRISRKQWVDPDTLHFLHPKAHRILSYRSDIKFEPGNLKMTITALADTSGRVKGFAYARSEYKESEGYVQMLDLGAHQLEGVPANPQKRKEFIVNEVARASYK